MGPLDLNEVNKISPVCLDKDLDYKESEFSFGLLVGQKNKNEKWHGLHRAY